VVQEARSGDGQRRAQRLAAVPAMSRARVGVDVPIEAKFHPPNLRPEWVDRRGLISALARTDAKLVLLGAPAGFGKTTLVAQWRASDAESRPFAWVSLDRGDDDPGRLWWHVVCALERACPQIGGEGILRALRVTDPKITGEVLPILINEVAALPAPVVLVLDDYHVITERDCHEQVAFLLRHMPAPLQMVLITRAEPALPLARLRTAGELAEIRAAELRFTAEPPAPRGSAVSRPDQHPRAVLRAAVRCRHRVGERGGPHRRPRAGKPVHRPAGRHPAVVPISPAVRRGTPRSARADRGGPGARTASPGQRLVPRPRVGGRGGQPCDSRGRLRPRHRAHRGPLVQLRAHRPGRDGAGLDPLARE